MRLITLAALATLFPIAVAAQQPTTPPPAPTPAPVVAPAPVIPAPATDTATPAAPAPASDLATIAPGMSRAQVEAAWGKAGNSRTDGSWIYLFYKNDCGRSCGTFDVVFLQNDRVTDAIVRASFRRYAGTSSSPAAR